MVIVLGVMHLLGRGDTSVEGSSGAPEVEWLSGLTSQGLPVGVRIEEERVTVVGMRWRAACRGGASIERHTRFEVGAAREGGFAGSDTRQALGADGRPYRPSAHVSGERTRAGARGAAQFMLSYASDGHCESGELTWSAGG